MEYQWKLKPRGKPEDVAHISRTLDLDESLANLLVQRGINTFEQARQFFRPKLTDLHNPFLMKDMDKAVARLKKAIAENEKILIYGDYDVDGTTSVSLVYSILKEYHSNLGFYIPDRYSEGYGISFEGIDFAYDNGYTLIIALDCGIKANKKMEEAQKKGVEFIIGDHHTPGPELPKAVAVLDPKRKDDEYPFKELSGCGVGFKLMQAFLQEGAEKPEPSAFPSERDNYLPQPLMDHLDLVCVSIASDIVPIVGENRTLAYYGLKKLNENPGMGLRALIEIAGISEQEITISDVVFKIGPRINAAGRIEKGIEAVKLLISDKEDTARSWGDKINAFNDERKNLDYEITQEALAMIANDAHQAERKTTVLAKEGWHKGVIGIVASRLIENYYRPTIIMTISDGRATGSARSVEGFDLYESIDSCSDLLESFGGHKYAAGLTLKLENLQEFSQRFEKIVAEKISQEQLTPQIEIDETLNFSQITPKFFRILKQFAPFGPGNMSPVFMTENVNDCGGSRIVGKTEEHLKLELINHKTPISGIAFSQARHIKIIKTGEPFRVCYAITENQFRGTVSLQLMVKDIKANDEEAAIEEVSSSEELRNETNIPD